MYEQVTALDACIEAISRGEPLEEVLARYPGHQEELRDLLQAAGLLRKAGETYDPAPTSLKGMKRRLMASLEAQEEHTRRRASG